MEARAVTRSLATSPKQTTLEISGIPGPRNDGLKRLTTWYTTILSLAVKARWMGEFVPGLEVYSSFQQPSMSDEEAAAADDEDDCSSCSTSEVIC